MPKIIKNKKKPKYIYDYENNGYAVIKNVFGSEIIGNINGHVSWLRKKNPKIRPESFHHHLLIKDPFIHYLLNYYFN